MKKIPRDSKILCITHNDWDAAVCSIILNAVYSNITFVYLNFQKVDDFMRSLDYNLYDFIILADINPTDHSLVNDDRIIILDHHHSATALNNPSKMHFIIEEHCASWLCKKFVEKMYNVDLSYLNSMVYLVNDYDLYTLKNGKSKLLNDLMFFKFGCRKFREEFKNGRTRFKPEEILWLRERREEFKKKWNELEAFDFDLINGCIVEANSFLNEIADKLLKEEEYKIVLIRNPSNGRVSLRHKIDNFDAGTYLKEKGFGGGHPQAAGVITFDERDFQMKAKEIEKYIYNNFIDVRKENKYVT